MSWDAVIAVIAEVVGTVAAVLAIYGSVRGVINKGITDKQKQIASASRTRPLFSGLAVLLIFVAAVVWVLHLVGIVVGGWSNPLVIVMITAGVVLVILQLAFPLGPSREDVAYYRLLERYNEQLASSNTRTIVIRGSKEMDGWEVSIRDDGDTIKSAIFNKQSLSEVIPIVVAVKEELEPKIYFIEMKVRNHQNRHSAFRFLSSQSSSERVYKVWKKRVDVQPKRVGEVDWRKEKPDYERYPSLTE